MRPSTRLFACRLTLFTRPNCGLCAGAKDMLARLRDRRPFAYDEVDVAAARAGVKAWRDLYDLDVPVVHISRTDAPAEDPKLASRAVKLMHRFSADDVAAKMDLVEAA